MVKKTDHRDHQVQAAVHEILPGDILSAKSASSILSDNAQLAKVAERVTRVVIGEEPLVSVYSGTVNALAHRYYLTDCQLLAAAYLQQGQKATEPAPIPAQTITLNSLKVRNFTVVLEGDPAVLINPRYSGYFRLVNVGPSDAGQFVKSQLHWHRPWIRRQSSITLTSVDALDAALSRHYLNTATREEMPLFDAYTFEPLSFAALKQLGFYRFLKLEERQYNLFVHSAALGWFELNEVRSINSRTQLSLTWINTADAFGPVLAQVWTNAQLADLVRSFYRVKLETEIR